MDSFKYVLGLVILASPLLALENSVADEQAYAHVHVGGGLAHPPFVFTSTTWYRDVVYDESSHDVHQTSMDIYAADPVEPRFAGHGMGARRWPAGRRQGAFQGAGPETGILQRTSWATCS